MIISLFAISFIPVFAEPIIVEPGFTVEEILTGLSFPVQMSFIENANLQDCVNHEFCE